VDATEKLIIYCGELARKGRDSRANFFLDSGEFWRILFGREITFTQTFNSPILEPPFAGGSLLLVRSYGLIPMRETIAQYWKFEGGSYDAD
jgi:hypothetical protein